MSIDQPDFGFAMLGPSRLPSVWERRSTLGNDNGVTTPTAPPSNLTGTTYKGKFFPRGCRCFLRGFRVYCKRTGAGTLTLAFSPQQGMGEIGTAVVTPGADWDWHAGLLEQFWNYDSMFVWVKSCDADVSFGYDVTSPYDGWHSTDNGVKWWHENRRYFIRILAYGLTAGDVPVSGIVNTIQIPSSSDTRLYKATNLDSDNPFVLKTIDGSGEIEYLVFKNSAETDSQYTTLGIYCDGKLAFQWAFSVLNDRGFTATTPAIQLLKYGADADCVMNITLKISFKRQLVIKAQRKAGAPTQATYLEGLVNLIT